MVRWTDAAKGIHTIEFYRLSDGRGYVHDFSPDPARQGEKMLSAVDHNSQKAAFADEDFDVWKDDKGDLRTSNLGVRELQLADNYGYHAGNNSVRGFDEQGINVRRSNH